MKHTSATPLSASGVVISKWAILLLAGISLFTQAAHAKAAGTVKSINGNSIIVTTDTGAEATLTLSDSARVLRAIPGQTDLKSATPIQVSDIKVGDRILALGPDGEGNSTLASTIVVMKQSDIADKQQQEREEWRRGVGGIVKEVNAPAGTITIANALVSSGKPIVIRVSSSATVRRYSPDSVKFDDAKPGTLDQIKPGDQLRARGQKNDDGTEFTAQAIVTGTFREIAGTVVSADAANGNITVLDLIAKKPVTLKVNSDSQIHKLPPFVARRIAMRLKGGAPAPNGDSNTSSGGQHPAVATAGGPNQVQGNWRGQNSQGDSQASVAGGGFRGAGGAPDFQQMLSRMPTVSLSDLQKGDAVMLVATEGGPTSAPTTITLLAGVEPILTAAPGGAVAAMILSPWNLGASPGGDSASQ